MRIFLSVAVRFAGKIARHFIRGALEEAIRLINQAEEIDDVTPVGKGQPYKADEGVESDGKLPKNPYVAIELGYVPEALAVHAQQQRPARTTTSIFRIEPLAY